jgi:Flp pilus assembly protein TadD
MAQKIAAFVAKSFDREDEAKISLITKFLDSFQKLGFIAQTAERAEVERVSEKVRSLIDQSDVFVGIFTRRHPVYRFRGRLATAISIMRGTMTPVLWGPPPWVLQESGYALKGNKPLILFREIGVDFPGLQGDLEYILFDPQNPSPALQRATEMITAIIAKAGSIKVETVVQSESIEVRGGETGAPPTLAVVSPQDEGSSQPEDLKTRIFALWRAVASGEPSAIEREYEAGLVWIRDREPDEELFWKCFYQRTLFSDGKSEAMDELRILAEENKSEYLALSYLAACFVDLHEYDEAVKHYLSAASLAKASRRASLEIEAVEILQKAKKAGEARAILLKLRDSDYAQEPKIQFQILENLYAVSKELDDEFASFAIGELALHQRPEANNFRFSLAYDYDVAGQEHLALHHYKILCDQDEKNTTGFNNLGVASSKCNLAVLATQRYKKAYALGNTLAASNLGYKYLEAGLSGEALELLKDAQNKENCAPEVPRAISAVYEKIEVNTREEEKVLARAQEQRNFLLPFAAGLFTPTPANLEGPWKFPAAEIVLKRAASTLHGARVNRTEVNVDFGLTAILGGGSPKSVTRIEEFEFSGTLSGQTCKFKLETNRYDDPASFGFSGLPTDSSVEGYILFAEDGLSGKVAELKDGKPQEYYVVSKSI